MPDALPDKKDADAGSSDRPPPFDRMGFVRLELLLWTSAILWVIPLYYFARYGWASGYYLITTLVKEYLWVTLVLLPVGLLLAVVIAGWAGWWLLSTAASFVWALL